MMREQGVISQRNIGIFYAKHDNNYIKKERKKDCPEIYFLYFL
jgi:hypothetical protein